MEGRKGRLYNTAVKTHSHAREAPNMHMSTTCNTCMFTHKSLKVELCFDLFTKVLNYSRRGRTELHVCCEQLKTLINQQISICVENQEKWGTDTCWNSLPASYVPDLYSTFVNLNEVKAFLGLLLLKDTCLRMKAVSFKVR